MKLAGTNRPIALAQANAINSRVDLLCEVSFFNFLVPLCYLKSLCYTMVQRTTDFKKINDVLPFRIIPYCSLVIVLLCAG